MKVHATTLFISDTLWRIGVLDQGQMRFLDVPWTAGSSIMDQAQAMQLRLASEGIIPGEVILALPSAWCLHASFARESLTVNAPKALLFALEEHLPIAAEDVVAGFVCHDQNVMGICTARERLSEVVKAVESQGWSIPAICPAPLLALSQWLATAPPRALIDAVLALEGEQWVLLSLEAGHLKSWHLLPPQWQDLQLRLQMINSPASDSPLRLLLSGLPSTVAELFESMSGLTLLPASQDTLEQAAASTASLILAGDRPLPLDLVLPGRRRSLTTRLHRPLSAVALSIVVLLVASVLAMLLAGWRMDRRTADLQAEQVSLFHKAVPNPRARVPRLISHYLSSELQRLQSGGDVQAESRRSASALQMLLDVFARLPASVPVQLTRVRVEEDNLEMVGQLRALEDAGALVTALGADGKLIVRPPQTNLGRDKDVTFTLQLQRRVDAAVNVPPKEQP